MTTTGYNARVGIVGGAGYTGGELLRILLQHPQVHITFIHSKSNGGKKVYQVHEDLWGETELTFTDDNTILQSHYDILFLCVGHGEAKRFLEEHNIHPQVRIIDLSQDFRLPSHRQYNDRNFVYGLPEQYRNEIQHAKNIANPGCFATAIQLALLPLAFEQLLDKEVYVTGITGSTGAGQSLSATSHFSWRVNNIQAYKTLQHQHLKEIGPTLQSVQQQVVPLHFVPWRGDFARGIFVSATLTVNEDIAAVQALYEDFYRDHPFTHVTTQPLALKQVINTNKCLLQLEQHEGKLVVHSAIDNLLKGASGQAVQNMNLMLGFPENMGLHLKPVAF
jgi:N-acetyl-gamma-glutamyl-phosphate reductase